MSKILIIDDDHELNGLLSDIVIRMGHSPCSAYSARDGLAEANQGNFDVILLDVGLPDGDGLQIMPQILEYSDPPEVIILTGNSNPDAAELAIKNGAWDYLVKPSSVDNIMLTIQRALAFRHEKRTTPPPVVLKRDDIVGKSACINATLERVAQAAAVESNVLISGETGTGKELLARTIHENSCRAKHPFVVVDCAALPESLVESVLFGHAKGAFTGADTERRGLIRQAHGGTLFLDEVGELPLTIQKAFLRVIQERRFRPVSSNQEVEVNFRLIAATNRNLDDRVAAGLFRNDLLFRLRSFEIEAPPLRQRNNDIKRLTLFYLSQLSEIYGTEIKGISNDFIEALGHYPWPGNVRELFHTLEEATSLAGGEPTLYPHCLPIRIRAILTRQMVKAHNAGVTQTPPLDVTRLTKNNFLTITDFRDTMERRYLEQLNHITRNNRKEACRISGLSRTRLFELLKKHDLSKPHAGKHPLPVEFYR
jgi:two-component system, NtrC family, response regulator